MFCRDKHNKTFVVTNMILVAAPANDSLSLSLTHTHTHTHTGVYLRQVDSWTEAALRVRDGENTSQLSCVLKEDKV